jgi:replication-associated recombination protein RarA
MMTSAVGDDPWADLTTHSGLAADEVISALQKDIRRGRAENAVKLAYDMVRTSPELEDKLWQRLKVISVEDVGWGDLIAPTVIDALDRFHLAFERGHGDRNLFAIHAVRYLCSRVKDRSSDEMTQWVVREASQGRMVPEIPDYALDMHTRRGREMGRGRSHFYAEGARVVPELIDRERTYHEKLMADLNESET